MENWIKIASNLEKIARDSNLLEKKVATKEIFGSNLRLASREARGNPQNQWVALQAAREMLGQKSESQIMEAWTGIAPMNKGFADLCLATWLPGHLHYCPNNNKLSIFFQGGLNKYYTSLKGVKQNDYQNTKDNILTKIKGRYRNTAPETNNTLKHGDKSRSE